MVLTFRIKKYAYFSDWKDLGGPFHHDWFIMVIREHFLSHVPVYYQPLFKLKKYAFFSDWKDLGGPLYHDWFIMVISGHDMSHVPVFSSPVLN